MKLVQALALVLGIVATPAQAAGPAAQVTVDGAIGPGTADYVLEAFADAQRDGAEVIVLAMDTPGGLDSAMRDIIRAVLASPVPVVGYVGPSGARAASAGTYILYATHIAAMAPGTNLGAATPVAIGGGLFRGKEGEDEKPAGEDAMARKVVNDAAAFIRGLADLRGRNATWAEKAVREAASLSAAEALEDRVVDLIAADVPALLAAVDGRTVAVGGGSRTLRTSALPIVRYDADWLQRLRIVLTNPNVAFLLLLLGIGGIAFEFLSPGMVAPGVLGGLALLLGLYGVGALPVDYAGLALLGFGLALMVAEMFLPTFGIIGIGGIAAFIVGAILAFPRGVPGLSLAWPVIIGAAVATAGFLAAAGWLALGNRNRAVVTGRESLIGSRAVVESWQGGEGTVVLAGERWRARSAAALADGAAVTVTAVRGITLEVEPAATRGGEAS